MAGTLVSWVQETERVVAAGHPTLADVTNRPLQQIFVQSGLSPSALFYGFAALGSTGGLNIPAGTGNVVGDLIVGTDPGGTAPLRVGGAVSITGVVGVGGIATATWGVAVRNAPISGQFQAAFLAAYVIDSSASTGNAAMFNSTVSTKAAAWTLPALYHYYATDVTLGAGSAVTIQYGLFLGSLFSAITNYGIYTNLGQISFGDNVALRAGTLTVTSTTPTPPYGVLFNYLAYPATFTGSRAQSGLVFQSNGTDILYIAAQTTAPAVWFAAQSGYGLTFSASGGADFRITAGTGVAMFGQQATFLNNLQVNNYIGLGQAPTSRALIQTIAGMSLTGVGIQAGFFFDVRGDNGAGANPSYGGYIRTGTSALAYTQSNLYGLAIDLPIIGAGSAVTTLIGLYINDQTSGATSYSIYTGLGALSFGDSVTIRSAGNLTVTSGTATFGGQVTISGAGPAGMSIAGGGGIATCGFISMSQVATTRALDIGNPGGGGGWDCIRIGLSQTGTLSAAQAASLINMAQTWNTTGVPTAIKLVVTNTASGAGSLLMDLRTATASMFSVSIAGAVTTAGALTVSAGGLTVSAGVSVVQGLTANGAVIIQPSGDTASLTITGPSQSSIANIVSITGTWNNALTIFKGILLNITNTNSQNGSRIVDFQVASVSMFSVDPFGTAYAGGLNLSNGVLVAGEGRFANAVKSGVVGAAYSASITPNAAGGNVQLITVTNTNAFTINNPSNGPSAGQTEYLTFVIFNNSGGVMGAITWDSHFSLAGAFTNPANGKRRTITFARDDVGQYYEVCRAAADI
jgi:hypothetical protein